MDNLADLLAKHKPEEPPEIRKIKDYVLLHFKEEVGVLLRDRDIVVTVRSSALAGALRMKAHELSEQLGGERRLTFRVGS